MPKNCISIIITLEDIEKINTENKYKTVWTIMRAITS